MTGTISGLTFVTIAGVANASFALPMKFTRRWAWENVWISWTFLALLLLPAVVAILSIPSLGAVYRDAGSGSIAVVMVCGAGWGLAQVLFGLSIDAIGIGLTFSIVLGVSAAVGSLIPLLRLQHVPGAVLADGPIFLGIALMLAGVFACAAAGQMREKAHSGSEVKGRSFGVGLAVALCSGLCAASMNFGVAFGQPLLRSATAHGASAQQVVNAVWLPLLAAGAIPNIGYCIFLLSRKHSWVNFRMRETPSNLGLAMVMAILWFFSTALYGVATTQLGDLGVVVGWPVFMSSIVVTAGILGIFTGEWKQSGPKPVTLQIVGMILLVLAVVALSRVQSHSSVTAHPDKVSQSEVNARIDREEAHI